MGEVEEMAAEESNIRLPTDGTGKRIRAIKLTVGSTEVYMEGAVVYDSSGTAIFSPTGDGLLALRNEIGSGAGETVTIADAEDISGGVTGSLNNYSSWTLYISVAAANTITIELSPDDETSWYSPSSTLVFGAAGTSVLEMPYKATDIKLTGSNSTNVTAKVRGKY